MFTTNDYVDIGVDFDVDFDVDVDVGVGVDGQPLHAEPVARPIEENTLLNRWLSARPL